MYDYDYGFVKLSRGIMNWDWYKDANTFRVYIHLLIKANFTAIQFRGKTIERGQIVISRSKIAEELKLSVQQVRTAISHLKSTNDITTEKCDRYLIITITHYDLYKILPNKSTQQSTDTAPPYQPDSNQISTRYQPLYNKKRNKRNKRSDRSNNYHAHESDEYDKLFESKSKFKD